MTSSPITSWHIDGKTVETVTDFIFWAPKSLQMVTTAMKRYLLLGRKAMTNLGSILKSRDITLQDPSSQSNGLKQANKKKAMGFPVVTYGCESWTIKTAEH